MMKTAFLSLGLFVGSDAIEDKPKKTFRQQITAQAHHLNMGGVAAAAGAAIGAGATFGNFAGALGTLSTDTNGAGGKTTPAEDGAAAQFAEKYIRLGRKAAFVAVPGTRTGAVSTMRLERDGSAPVPTSDECDPNEFYLAGFYSNTSAARLVPAYGDCISGYDAVEQLQAVTTKLLASSYNVSDVMSFAFAPDAGKDIKLASLNVTCAGTTDGYSCSIVAGSTPLNVLTLSINKATGALSVDTPDGFDLLPPTKKKGEIQFVIAALSKMCDRAVCMTKCKSPAGDNPLTIVDIPVSERFCPEKCANEAAITACKSQRGGAYNTQSQCKTYVAKFEKCIPSMFDTLGLVSHRLSDLAVTQTAACFYQASSIVDTPVSDVMSYCGFEDTDKLNDKTASSVYADKLVHRCAPCASLDSTYNDGTGRHNTTCMSGCSSLHVLEYVDVPGACTTKEACSKTCDHAACMNKCNNPDGFAVIDDEAYCSKLCDREADIAAATALGFLNQGNY